MNVCATPDCFGVAETDAGGLCAACGKGSMTINWTHAGYVALVLGGGIVVAAIIDAQIEKARNLRRRLGLTQTPVPPGRYKAEATEHNGRYLAAAGGVRRAEP